jgi:hypothetical protein
MTSDNALEEFIIPMELTQRDLADGSTFPTSVSMIWLSDDVGSAPTLHFISPNILAISPLFG